MSDIHNPSSLDASGGPYPTNVNYVIGLYQRLQDWTAFCDKPIPLQNFAGYVGAFMS